MTKFYVYGHFTKDTNELFYVGKGFGKRLNSKSSRNKYWKNIVGKRDFKSKILINDLKEEEAYFYEKLLLKKFKKRGLCKANLAVGGKGNTKNKKYLCVSCKNSLANIYAKRCAPCRKVYVKSETFKKKASKSAKERVKRLGLPQGFNRSGKKLSKKSKEKELISKGHKCFFVVLEGKILKTYINKSECSRDLGIGRKIIANRLKDGKTYKGYSFKYKEKI